MMLKRVQTSLAKFDCRLLSNDFKFYSTTNNLMDSITLEDLNQNIRKMEYAVRGPLVIKANEYRRELAEGRKDLPFKSVISANIGDCHAMNQKPVTFFRQVLACAVDNKLLSDGSKMPEDVRDRARELLSYCGGQSVGAYTDSCGLELVRRNVAKYIEERDGGDIKCDWQNVFLSTGASQAIKAILSLINHSRKPGKPVGVMIPIPQYPLYSATLCEFNQHQVNYYLDEDNDWRLNEEELERAYEEESGKCDLRAICVINPGNPTGSILSEENILQVLKFAHKHNLMVLADEVYQQNVYRQGSKFNSFKKVLFEHNNKCSDKINVQLASFMSASKGYMGECGLRAGYCELANFHPDVRAALYKSLSAWLCSSVLGQMAMDCIVNPPKQGQQSYELFAQERQQILDDLKTKAKLVADTFNSVPAVKSNEVAGAMYAFPRLLLPSKAIQAAKEQGQAADFFYALNFLNQTGICVVPGSGFGQKPGTYHFRTTILPQPVVFEDMMERFKKFHLQFLDKYSS